jgi:hypothetical protein
MRILNGTKEHKQFIGFLQSYFEIDLSKITFLFTDKIYGKGIIELSQKCGINFCGCAGLIIHKEYGFSEINNVCGIKNLKLPLCVIELCEDNLFYLAHEVSHYNQWQKKNKFRKYEELEADKDAGRALKRFLKKPEE